MKPHFKRQSGVPYREQKRVLGEGLIRLGTFIIPTEDIHCLVILSCLKDDIIRERINIIENKPVEEECIECDRAMEPEPF